MILKEKRNEELQPRARQEVGPAQGFSALPLPFGNYSQLRRDTATSKLATHTGSAVLPALRRALQVKGLKHLEEIDYIQNTLSLFFLDSIYSKQIKGLIFMMKQTASF